MVVHNHNKKGGQNFREKIGGDHIAKNLAELTINVTIFKSEVTVNAFFKNLHKEGAK